MWEYRCKRLSFGVNAAAEKFQQMIQIEISDLPNYKNISHDIIIYGKNRQEHDQSINQLSKCLISVSTDSKAHHPVRKE